MLSNLAEMQFNSSSMQFNCSDSQLMSVRIRRKFYAVGEMHIYFCFVLICFLWIIYDVCLSRLLYLQRRRGLIFNTGTVQGEKEASILCGGFESSVSLEYQPLISCLRGRHCPLLLVDVG